MTDWIELDNYIEELSKKPQEEATPLELQKRRVWCNINELHQMHRKDHWEAWENYLNHGRKFTPLYGVDLIFDLWNYGVAHIKTDYQLYLNTWHDRDFLRNGASRQKQSVVKDYLSDVYQKWFEVEFKI